MTTTPRPGGQLGGYVLRRLGFAAVLVLVALTIDFVLIHAAPGDPVTLLAGEGGDPAYYARIRSELGLDLPLGEQYLRYLGSAAHGDLGYSIAYRQPVVEVIGARFGPTLLLMVPALLLAVTVGGWLGVAAGRRAGSRADELISAGTLVGSSVPSFWVGQLLVIVFAVGLGWLPVQGMSDPHGSTSTAAHVLDVAHHLVLPVLTLALFQLALIARLVRSSLAEVLVQDHIRMARAKGLGPRTVLYRHGVRNALLPVTTVIGSQFGALIAGAVLVETIFSWPGLGRLLYDSTLARDYPVLLGLFALVSVAVVIANLVTDLSYAALDPRVEYR
ncbi:MAG: hypothetical protein ABS81_01010 [Pseudonocardia sp. SCN 72-86]|nr:MAG: hypothetical protein ABS81_01010 [Pseudonocardia sp. SCN 72-86]